MAEKLPELVRRQRATQATMKRYRDKPFDWKKGATCIHMLRYHLRKMGHKPEKMPRIRSAIGARRQLDMRGCENVSDLMDKMGLERIGHACMIQGDVAVLRSGDGFGSVTISVGGAKVIGWHDDVAGMSVLQPLEIDGAWRA